MKGHKFHVEHDNHFEIQHPDGSLFKVSKKGLDKSDHEKIRRMPRVKLWAGGSPEDGEEDDTETPNFKDSGQYGGLAQAYVAQNPSFLKEPLPNTPLANSLRGQDPADQTPQYMGGAAPVPTPMISPVTAAPELKRNPNIPEDEAPTDSGAVKPVSYGSPPIAVIPKDPNAEVIKAIREGGRAAAQAATDSAKSYQENIAALKEANDDAKLREIALNAEQKQLRDDIASNKVDPNRIWNNASTGNKILGGIAILLGGASAGVLHGPNLALQVFDKAIDDDIAAQKSEIGKKENLLSDNLKRYGNLQAATQATRLNLSTALQGQLASYAAKAQGPQAIAQAELLVNQLQARDAQATGALAAFNNKNNLYDTGGDIPGITPSIAQNVAKDSWVNTPNGIRFTKSPEDAKKLTEAQGFLANIDTTTKRMQGFLDHVGTTLNPLGANASNAKGLKSNLTVQLKNLFELGVLSKDDMTLLEPLIPNLGGVDQAKTQAQINTINQMIKDRMRTAYANKLVKPGELGGDEFEDKMKKVTGRK